MKTLYLAFIGNATAVKPASSCLPHSSTLRSGQQDLVVGDHEGLDATLDLRLTSPATIRCCTMRASTSSLSCAPCCDASSSAPGPTSTSTPTPNNDRTKTNNMEELVTK